MFRGLDRCSSLGIIPLSLTLGIIGWNIHILWKLVNQNFQGEVTNIQFQPLKFYHALSNLDLAFEFACPFIIRKGAFLSNKVENLIVVFIVTNVTSNQLSHTYHAFHIRSALNQKIPLALYLVHFFLLKCLPNPRLIKGIDHRFGIGSMIRLFYVLFSPVK